MLSWFIHISTLLIQNKIFVYNVITFSTHTLLKYIKSHWTDVDPTPVTSDSCFVDGIGIGGNIIRVEGAASDLECQAKVKSAFSTANGATFEKKVFPWQTLSSCYAQIGMTGIDSNAEGLVTCHFTPGKSNII